MIINKNREIFTESGHRLDIYHYFVCVSFDTNKQLQQTLINDLCPTFHCSLIY